MLLFFTEKIQLCGSLSCESTSLSNRRCGIRRLIEMVFISLIIRELSFCDLG